MTRATREAAALARLDCLAGLLRAYCEAETECWTCLSDLVAALEDTRDELRRLLDPPPDGVPRA